MPERSDDADPDQELLASSSSPALSVTRRQRRLEPVGQVVIGKPDLVAEDRLGVGQGVGDGAGADVAVEQAGVQHEQLDEGGEAALPRLQDHVLAVHASRNSASCAEFIVKRDAAAALVGDLVEIVQPPRPVGQAGRPIRHHSGSSAVIL